MANIKDRNNIQVIILISAILIYTSIFSYATIQKHRNFYSYAWDLGVFDQVFHNSLFENKLFHYNCDSYLNIKENYLAFHFSPILILLFPFYYLFPWISTLLFMKSLILALGAYPLFLLAKKILNDQNQSLIIALIYLIQPGLQASNWFDFQPQIFIPLILFSTYLFFLEKKWGLFYPILILGFLIEEHVFIIYGTMIAGYYLVERNEIVELINPKNERTKAIAVSLFIAAIIFLIGAYTKTKYPVNELYMDVFQTSKSFEILEFKGSGFLIPFYVLRNPIKSIAALSHDLDLKFLYIIFLYAPLLFLPLLTLFSIPSLVLYIPFLLSNYRAYYTLGAHYYLYLITSIFIGLIYSFKYLGDSQIKYSRHIFTLSVCFIILLSPLSPASQILNKNQQVLWYPAQSRTTQEISNLRELVSLIPEKASILTVNHLYSHVSGRLDAYVVPVVKVDETAKQDMEQYVEQLIEKSEYILLDLNVLDEWSKYVFDKIVTDEKFGVWKIKGNSVIFKQGESNTSLPGKIEQEFTITDLQLGNHEIEIDPILEETVAINKKGSKPALFVYGPYIFLPEGNYRIRYKIKVESPEALLLGYIQVINELENVVTRKNIWSFDYIEGKWYDIDVIIGLDDISLLTEFQIFSYGKADITISKIEITPIPGNITSSTKSFYYENLASPNAEITDEKIISRANNTKHTLWYGPYAEIKPGFYQVQYNLRATPLEQNASEQILHLDVLSSKQLQTLAEYEFTRLDANNGSWRKITLSFHITEPTTLEFRGMYPSDTWTIEFSEVTLNPVIPQIESFYQIE